MTRTPILNEASPTRNPSGAFQRGSVCLWRWRPSAGQLSGLFLVVPVYVREERESVSVVHPGSEVHDVSWNCLVELDRLLGTGLHGADDPRLVPLRIITQHVLRERCRLLDADAPVTQGTSGTRKEGVGWRVMEIDVEGAWEEELDMPERIA